MIDFLYRGFNSDIALKVALTPKNRNGKKEMSAQCGDERVQCGDEDFTCGTSIANALHLHEIGQNGDPTGYISFTPNFERARDYALKGGEYEEGTVIKVSVNALKQRGFELHQINEVISHPAYPKDDEHTVYIGEKKFPLDVIVEETPVYRE